MIQILIHVLPQEIDQLEQQLICLKHSCNWGVEKNDILIDCVLNINLVNWEQSKFPKKYFIDKFNNLELFSKSFSQTQFEINEDGSIQGCVSHRRKSIRESTSEHILMLDTNVITSQTLLINLINTVKLLKDKDQNYIITPQITPMWDHSWDVIVNENYINDGITYRERDPYKCSLCFGNISIEQIDGFKFGGGWATCINTKLAKFIDIPDSLGHYGLEDTYIMSCAQLMKKKGLQVQQYVLKNEIIVKNSQYIINPYQNYLLIIDKKDEFRETAHKYFEQEIKLFWESKINLLY